MYTGTRPGVSPAIRAGKGWRGRRELAPRCSATQLSACLCVHIDRDMIVIPSSEPQPPHVHAPGQTRAHHKHHNHHNHHNHHRLRQVCEHFVMRCNFMAESSCRPRMVDGDGAANRRRQRRLRSWCRHEQQTVAAVLATTAFGH